MNLTVVLAIGGGLALLVLAVGAVVLAGERRSVVDERMDRYASATAGSVAVAAPAGQRASPLGERLNKALANRGFAFGIQTQLARADLKLNVGEYFSLIAISAVGAGAVAGILTRSLVYAILGGVAGLFIPRFYIRSRQTGRLRRFDDQLSDMINLVVNGLKAGYSVMQALESVGREMPAPISVEFHRVVQEMQLGLAMEAALDNLLRRIPSDDLDLMVTAINVQREVGGNLADILATISHTIRERVRIKGEIRVLTSQQRGSAWFLSLMPFALAGVLFLANRPYMAEFFKPRNQPLGYIMVGLALLLIVSGIFVMNKIVDINV